jgi:hypothetical protein
MQEQLSHGMLEASIIGQTGQGLFLDLFALYHAKTQGCSGQKVFVPTERHCTQAKSSWKEEGQDGRQLE